MSTVSIILLTVKLHTEGKHQSHIYYQVVFTLRGICPGLVVKTV